MSEQEKRQWVDEQEGLLRRTGYEVTWRTRDWLEAYYDERPRGVEATGTGGARARGAHPPSSGRRVPLALDPPAVFALAQ